METKSQAGRKQILHLGIVLSITLLLLACIAMGSVAGQDSNEYSIDVDSSVTVVPQEITVDRPGFGTYQVDLIGLYNPGDSITASVTTPDDIDPSSVEFQLYDPSGQLIAENVPDGGQATFNGNTTELSPGTYQLVALSSSQQAEALTPIVISGYDISVTHASTVEQSGKLSVDGTIEETEATEPPASLNVVLRNKEYNERVSVETSGDSYSTNISMTKFPSGEYNLYVTANGDEQYQGENEIKDIAGGDTVTVTQADTDDDDDSDKNGDDDDGDSGNGDNDDTDSSNGDNSDSDDNDGESSDNDSSDGDNDGSDNSDSNSGDGDSGDSGSSDDVIEPGSSSNESTNTNPTSTDDQTSLNISLIIVAILISTAYVSYKMD